MINDEKTEYMKPSRKDRMYQRGESVDVEGYIFYRLPQFKYSDVLVTQGNNLKIGDIKKITIRK